MHRALLGLPLLLSALSLAACGGTARGAAGDSTTATVSDSTNTVTLSDSAMTGADSAFARTGGAATGSVGGASSASVSLHRESCRGGCVPYRLTLDSDGQVSFALVSDNVERRDAISAASVNALLTRMRTGGFPALDSAYVQGSRGCGAYAMDAPVVVLTLRADGATHTVRHDYGCAALPRTLREWGAAADSIASTQRWLPSSSGASR